MFWLRFSISKPIDTRLSTKKVITIFKSSENYLSLAKDGPWHNVLSHFIKQLDIYCRDIRKIKGLRKINLKFLKKKDLR